MITISKVNNSFIKIDSEDYGELKEIQEQFTFEIPNKRYNPKVKAGMWDGLIRMFNLRTKQLPYGLITKLIHYCEMSDIKYENLIEQEDRSFYAELIKLYCKRLQPCAFSAETKTVVPIEHYDFQLHAICQAIINKRQVLLSATSSGKSLIIYSILRWLIEKEFAKNDKILIIVPTINLVNQMYADFEEYSLINGWDVENNCHKVFGGQDKHVNKKVCISTWQSLHELPPEYFNNVRCLVADECHAVKDQNKFCKVIEICENADFRIGTSGTINNTVVNQLTLVGYIGEIEKIISNKEMMDAGQASKLVIENFILKYPAEICKDAKGLEYKDEIDFIINCKKRNEFICKIAKTRTHNTLILFAKREHGQTLLKMLKDCGKTVLYIDGTVKPEVREAARKIAEKQNDIIIVASYKTFATGTSIKNLNYLIFAHPLKSQIMIMQSLGRLLRKGLNMDVKAIDIIDDLSHKKHKNYAFEHFLERMEIYIKEKFDYNIRRFDI